MTKILHSTFRFLASLKLAVFLLVVFAVILSVATFYESHTSTEAAQQLIYKSAWFDFFLFLLGVNVLFAALSRFPWKKRHIGFVITHLGIIIILLGSVITRKFGVEGQLVLREGNTADSILINESVFAVELPRLNVRQEYDPWFMNKGIPAGKELRYAIGETDIDCYVAQYLFNPRVLNSVTNDNPQLNPAVQVALHQPGQTQSSMEEWLFASSATENQLDLGMARLRFQRVDSQEALQAALAKPSNEKPAPDGQIVLKDAKGQAIQVVPVKELMVKPFVFELGDKNYEVQFVQFVARSAIENNELIDRSNGALNPSVKFMLKTGDASEEHLAFAQFPDLGSFHGKDKNTSGLTAQFIYPMQKYSGGGNEAVIVIDEKGQLHYRAGNTSGQYISDKVQIGTPFQTTWPAVNVSVKQYYPNARKTEDIIDAGKDAPGPHNNPVVRVRLESNGQSAERYVAYNRTQTVAIGNETVTLEFGQKEYPLGFSIQLIDFQAPRYPGTNRPARFQSMVKLSDPANNVEKEQLVYMNNPLAYNRFLVYQSGYEEGRNGGPDISIFSVAWAPGTPTIYVGSIILCLGMVYMFINRKLPSQPQKKESK